MSPSWLFPSVSLIADWPITHKADKEGKPRRAIHNFFLVTNVNLGLFFSQNFLLK